MKKAVTLSLFLLILTVFPITPTLGQTTGSISGDVKDEKQAVINNAAVTVRNVKTNDSRTTQTDSDGRYRFTGMWVQPVYIGTGIGKDLFLDAMERAAKMNVSEIELSADPNAAGFYERLGATRIADVDSEIDGKPRKLPRMKVDVR